MGTQYYAISYQVILYGEVVKTLTAFIVGVKLDHEKVKKLLAQKHKDDEAAEFKILYIKETDETGYLQNAEQQLN